MTVPKRVIPSSNLSPGSQQWGREQEGFVIANRDAINQLGAQNDSDYRQFNAAVNGAAEQTYKVRDSVYQLPGAWIYEAQYSGFSMTAQTWTMFANVRLPLPRNKARATVYANADVNVVNPNNGTVYVSVYSGIGTSLGSPVPSIDYRNTGGKLYRQGQYSHSAVFELGRRGGSATAQLQLWSSQEIPPDSETYAKFSIYYLYGGGSMT